MGQRHQGSQGDGAIRASGPVYALSAFATPSHMSARSLSALKRGCAAMCGLITTLSNVNSSSSLRPGRLVERIEREAAEPARFQRLDQGRAVDELGARNVDQHRAGLHLRELGAADQPARRGRGRQVRHHPVALGQESFKRHVGDVERALLCLGQARALVIERAHAECRRPHRDLAADLAEPDDADRRFVEHAHAGNARPVGIGRVPAVERLVRIAGRGKLLDADPAHHAVELLGEREHQRERHLRAGAIDAPADGQKLDAPRRAGGVVDVARQRAEFLHDREIGAGRELLAPDPQPIRRSARGCRAAPRASPAAIRPCVSRPGTGFPPARARACNSRRNPARRGRRNPQRPRSARPPCSDRAGCRPRAGRGRLRRPGRCSCWQGNSGQGRSFYSSLEIGRLHDRRPARELVADEALCLRGTSSGDRFEAGP